MSVSSHPPQCRPVEHAGYYSILISCPKPTSQFQQGSFCPWLSHILLLCLQQIATILMIIEYVPVFHTVIISQHLLGYDNGRTHHDDPGKKKIRNLFLFVNMKKRELPGKTKTTASPNPTGWFPVQYMGGGAQAL